MLSSSFELNRHQSFGFMERIGSAVFVIDSGSDGFDGRIDCCSDVLSSVSPMDLLGRKDGAVLDRFPAVLKPVFCIKFRLGMPSCIWPRNEFRLFLLLLFVLLVGPSQLLLSRDDDEHDDDEYDELEWSDTDSRRSGHKPGTPVSVRSIPEQEMASKAMSRTALPLPLPLPLPEFFRIDLPASSLAAALACCRILFLRARRSGSRCFRMSRIV